MFYLNCCVNHICSVYKIYVLFILYFELIILRYVQWSVQTPISNAHNVAFESLRAVLMSVDRVDKESILIGNTACDLVDNGHASTKRIKQVYSEFQMGQLIATCTWVATNANDNGTKTISKSLIDHFYTSDPRYILKTYVVKAGMVDH